MVINQFGGYSVQRINPDRKNSKYNKMYVRTAYAGRAKFVTDYSRAKVYKSKAAAARVDQGLDSGAIQYEI